MHRVTIAFLFAFCALSIISSLSADEHEHQSELITTQQRPLADGLTPHKAAAHMSVLQGFKVQLAAGEPQVHQPIAFTIDHRGRLWVAEAYTYPNRAPEGEGKDKIVILEDTDQDGTLDSRKVFMEGLNLVSGMEVGFGGVWVGAAPYLMFIPDEDGDDKPDAEPQILLDGFGYQDTHETLNAFIWGPDGWLYGCHGVFTHSRVGKPGTPDSQRTPLNAGVWRYHPTRHDFEVFARGTSNPWGVDFNDHGHAFITACVIPHLYHVIPGARYQRQGGRHFNQHVYDDIKTIADHLHYAGNIRDHAWWGDEPEVPQTTLAAGGGHAHCGAMIYQGDNWPTKYRNNLFFCNIHGNRVNQDVLERRGSGYVGHHGKDVLLANDRWFRGINLKYAPDGSVYLIDWYDPNACHRTNPEIWDRSNGRIYRVIYGDVKPATVDLRTLDETELAKLHLHPNEWYVRIARRILQERAANGSVDTARSQLTEIITKHDDVARRLRALWTLHTTGGVDSDRLLALMDDADENIRTWAIQLEAEDQKFDAPVLDKLANLAASDESQMVRLHIASALQRMSLDQRWEIAEALAMHSEDEGDHNLPLMYWYAVEPLVPLDVNRALQLSEQTEIPLLSRFIIRRAASENDLLNRVVALLSESQSDSQQEDILGEMLRAFEGRVNIPMPPAWTPAYEALSKSESATIRERADRIAVVLGDRRILPTMRNRLADGNVPLSQRKQALDIILQGRDRDAAPALQSVLGHSELRGPALRALAGYDHAATPQQILVHYSQLTDSEKQDAINTLVARPSYAHALLDAIEADRVPRTDVTASSIRQLISFHDDALKERIESVWGAVRETSADKRQQIEELKSMLHAQLSQANLGNGRRLFNKTCASCHTLFGEGEKVGPDITGADRGNIDYLLENIFDPSAVVGKDYRMTSITTDAGRTVNGLVLRETDSALTVRTANDTVVVAKNEIEDRFLTELSQMPEGLLAQIPPHDIRDLIAYLATPVQVPLRGPDAPIDAATKRVPDALEGESLKIVGKTGGNVSSQPMTSFPNDKWSGNSQLWWAGAKTGDRLELEIPVAKAGTYNVELVLTRARDYGVVQLHINGEKLGKPIDLFNSPDVMTTGVLTFENIDLPAGETRLAVEIIGKHAHAVPAYMFALDYVRLVPSGKKSNGDN